MRSYKAAFGILLVLFLIANGAYVHRVPGLLGDEGSEGENVYELLQRESITVVGERSYIGPAIDYLRVPFVWVFGYTALALRMLVFLFGVVTFFLAASVLRRSFGDTVGLFALAVFAFSPIFLLYGRIGWAITLYPFFAFLIIYCLQRTWRTKWLWAGLAAGLGLANHVVFFSILAGVAAGVGVYGVVHWILRWRRYPSERHRRPSGHGSPPKDGEGEAGDTVSSLAGAASVAKRMSASLLLAVTGFWAGFGMQFVVLQLKTDDQGDPSQTTQLFSERVSDAISALPLYLSGSSFVARYTGTEFSPTIQIIITGVLLILAVAAIILNWRNPALWGWGIGLHVLLLATLYVIDRFTLRYFMTYAMGMWLFAGIGLGSVVQKVLVVRYSLRATPVPLAVLSAIALMGWMTLVVLIPFFQTGGSTADFGLGNRTDSAAAFVDIRPLVDCLRGHGQLFSENVHIWNRLQYLSHSDPEIVVTPEAQKGRAEILIEYRNNNMPQQGDICPELTHFRVKNI